MERWKIDQKSSAPIADARGLSNMALSRWSHSDHYIYEPVGGDKELHITFLGTFSAYDILYNWHKIEKAIEESEYSFYSFLSKQEFKWYLISWSQWQLGMMDIKKYLKILNALRLWGVLKCYVDDPWYMEFDRMQLFYFPKWLGGLR